MYDVRQSGKIFGVHMRPGNTVKCWLETKKCRSLISRNRNRVIGSKRGRLSPCLLSYFPVTISLEKHGELTAFSRCSNYLPGAICGKSSAHEDKLYSNHTNLTTSTLYQGRENWVQEKNLKEDTMRLNILSSKDIQSENIIDYTSMRKKEEFERYQDCSWFQKKSSKEDLTSKCSQAEALISPDFEVNDLDLEMHFGNRDIPPWGDEYLEVFDDEDFHYDLGDKFGEKENYIHPSNYNTSFINCKLKEDGVSDLSSYNCTIKKTDSYDNMKGITSTNLSDIIPITYKEQVNNINYNLQPFKEIKNEVKEEFEPYSSGSDRYIIDSDDCDLNIGREETIEVEVCGDGQEINYQKPDSTASTEQFESSGLKIVEDNSMDVGFVKDKREDLKCGTSMNSPNVNAHSKEVPCEETKEKELNEIPHPVEKKKTDLKLELSKNSFDNPVVNLPTPELDFMDLVHYINNEMLPDAMASPTTYFSRPSVSSDDMPLKESPPNTVTDVPAKQLIPQEPETSETIQNFRKPAALKKVVTENKSTKRNKTTTINSKDVFDSMSIAERIKTGSTRKRSRKISATSKHTEKYDEDSDKSEKDYCDDDDNDDDDDEEYGVVPRKRKRRSKSRNSESASSNNFGEVGSERDSYRERRDKNNEASRRSRQNKKDKERLMYKSREEAEKKNAVLRAKADKLEKLVTYLRQLLLQVVLRRGTGT